jgi:tetrahydromethanopterin S-methyltransferase subunit G
MLQFLKIGALAGGLAGLALALFLEIVGERAIDRAVSLEELAKTGSSNEMFSRFTQQVGGGIGAVLYGVAMGLIFAVVFASIRHRLRTPTDFRRALFVGAAGFLTVFLVPFAKYPANPPGVGDPSSITRRTILYLIMVGWSLVTTYAAWRLARWLRDDRGLPEDRWVPLTAIVYTAVITIGWLALPPNTDQVGVPAILLWRFRLTTAGGATVFWTTFGLGAGALLARQKEKVLSGRK